MSLQSSKCSKSAVNADTGETGPTVSVPLSHHHSWYIIGLLLTAVLLALLSNASVWEVFPVTKDSTVIHCGEELRASWVLHLTGLNVVKFMESVICVADMMAVSLFPVCHFNFLSHMLFQMYVTQAVSCFSDALFLAVVWWLCLFLGSTMCLQLHPGYYLLQLVFYMLQILTLVLWVLMPGS